LRGPQCAERSDCSQQSSNLLVHKSPPKRMARSRNASVGGWFLHRLPRFGIVEITT
jgi:hypothetical protein